MDLSLLFFFFFFSLCSRQTHSLDFFPFLQIFIRLSEGKTTNISIRSIVWYLSRIYRWFKQKSLVERKLNVRVPGTLTYLPLIRS